MNRKPFPSAVLQAVKCLLPFALLLALSGCPSSGHPPPAISEYVKTQSGNFVIERQRDVRYSMTYELRKPIAQPVRYEVQFENPAPRGRPITIKGAIEPGENRFRVQSPVLPGIRNDTNYDVRLLLLSGEEVIAQHFDQVRFSLSKSELSLLDINLYLY